MHMFNIQHKEHVQINNDSYIRKPRLSGNFLGNEGVRINEVSLYIQKIINAQTDLIMYVSLFLPVCNNCSSSSTFLLVQQEAISKVHN